MPLWSTVKHFTSHTDLNKFKLLKTFQWVHVALPTRYDFLWFFTTNVCQIALPREFLRKWRQMLAGLLRCRWQLDIQTRCRATPYCSFWGPDLSRPLAVHWGPSSSSSTNRQETINSQKKSEQNSQKNQSKIAQQKNWQNTSVGKN